MFYILEKVYKKDEKDDKDNRKMFIIIDRNKKSDQDEYTILDYEGNVQENIPEGDLTSISTTEIVFATSFEAIQNIKLKDTSNPSMITSDLIAKSIIDFINLYYSSIYFRKGLAHFIIGGDSCR